MASIDRMPRPLARTITNGRKPSFSTFIRLARSIEDQRAFDAENPEEER